MTDKGRQLYQALAAGDAGALGQLLSADFQGQLAEGLPHRLGRHYDGLDAMMTDGWGAVGQYFAISPRVQELLDCGDVLVGRGHYVGSAKPTGKPVRAAFAHFWRFNGDQFTAVIQVTDTWLWRDALLPD